jgi:hypothetical protein
MKGKRFSEEQIIAVLKEAEAGAKTKDLCRRQGISDATFYNCKTALGASAPSRESDVCLIARPVRNGIGPSAGSRTFRFNGESRSCGLLEISNLRIERALESGTAGTAFDVRCQTPVA